LIPIINDIGFYFVIVGLFFFWLSTRLVYGARAAMVAMALFAFSPMILELDRTNASVPAGTLFFRYSRECCPAMQLGWRPPLTI
jgi:hypothetical protein